MLQREIEVALIVMRLARTWARARKMPGGVRWSDEYSQAVEYARAERALVDAVERYEEEERSDEARLPF
jgi:hypothetical protein